MAAADPVERLISPLTFVPTDGPIWNIGNVRRLGNTAFWAMPYVDAGFTFEVRGLTNGTPVLGYTFSVAHADPDEGDGNPGKVVSLGISIKRLASTTDDYTDTGFGTEKEFALTTDATQGQVTFTDCAFLAAETDTSLATGERFLVKVRRRKGDSSDTHLGTVLIGPIGVRESSAT